MDRSIIGVSIEFLRYASGGEASPDSKLEDQPSSRSRADGSDQGVVPATRERHAVAIHELDPRLHVCDGYGKVPERRFVGLRAGSQLLDDSSNRLRGWREERLVRVGPELPEGADPS